MTGYWKFLRAGAVSPFSGYRWPTPGEWVQASGVEPCRRGWHACRTDDLPYWLTEELWQVELAGTVVTTPSKVVASRARLLARVPGWTPATALALSLACTGRVAGHAADELRDAGLTTVAQRLDEEAARLATATSVSTVDDPGLVGRLDALAGLAGELVDEAHRSGRTQAARLCGYVGDAVTSTRGDPVASVAYIAARAANHRSRADTADPYLTERAWQAGWLVDQLGLAG
jgi:hypothetical protein